MKTKNKKILTRLSAVLASCLLLVVLAVPCFADQTEPLTLAVKSYTFTDNQSIVDFVDQNYDRIAYMSLSMLVSPNVSVKLYADNITITSNPVSGELINLSGNSVNYTINGYYSVTSSFYVFAILADGLYVGQSEIDFDTGETLTVNGQNNLSRIDDDAYELLGVELTIGVYEEFTPTVAPIDPDAPTRTGLYGELYHIIRDAIYGENALLDSTQEFTLTQISTWMTYIVILLPLVVIAIILFKIFVR